MNNQLVNLKLPAKLFAQIKELAEQENAEPVEIVNRLVTEAQQRSVWLQELSTLRDHVEQGGVVNFGLTGQEMIKKIREIRKEIFEAEYAHLYR